MCILKGAVAGQIPAFPMMRCAADRAVYDVFILKKPGVADGALQSVVYGFHEFLPLPNGTRRDSVS